MSANKTMQYYALTFIHMVLLRIPIDVSMWVVKKAARQNPIQGACRWACIFVRRVFDAYHVCLGDISLVQYQHSQTNQPVT